MKAKGSTFVKCEFCSNPDGAQYATIDPIFICQTCHEVLLRHGIGKNEEQIESEKQRWVNERIAEVLRREYGSLRSPSSRTQGELETKSAQLRYGLFFLGAIGLWVFGEASLISLIVTFIVAIFIAREYRMEQLSRFADAIQAELDEEQRKIEAEFNQAKKQVSERVAVETTQLFSKYIEIIRHANKKGISLLEYLVSEYPPDWELRKAKVKERDGYRCQNCGAPEHLQVHHKQPVGGGGTHHLFNLITLCRRCHYEHHFGESNFKSLGQIKRAV